MKILVTGSRGFVGASFGAFAAAAGHELLGISRSSQPEPGWPGRHVQGDAAQADLAPIIRDFAPDLLLQAAGSASVGASLADPVGDFRATAVTLVNVLDGVRRSGCKPLVVFPSSAAVYGNPASLPVSESSPLSPISPYGFHKFACETIAREYAYCFGIGSVICRIFSLFGSRQRRLLVWEMFAQLAGSTDKLQLQGTGTETRDFLHSDDLARAILMLAETAPREKCTVVNVASGRETQILALAESMREMIAPQKAIECRGIARPGDPHRWCADVGLLRSMIPDWAPQEFSAALAGTVRQWKSAKA